jgi:hypothetical protein
VYLNIEDGDYWKADREGCFKNFIRNSINLLSLVLPRTLRLDKGTETGLMATMHCFLRDQQGDLEDANSSIVYGPSTQNKIERWWRELLERMERFFKKQLAELVESGDYDPTNDTNRCV